MIPMSLIVNRSNVERISDIPARKIQKLLISDCGEFVCVFIKPTKSQPEPEPQVVLMSALEQEFHDYRKRSAEGLIVLYTTQKPYGLCHYVEGQSGTEYTVIECPQLLRCNCEDWQQHETLCKHGWAVLHSLGCSSLLELWALRKREREAAQAQPIAQRIDAASQRSRPRPTTIRGVSID